MDVELVAIDSLTPDPNNARGHEKGVPELAASLREFGQRKNLVVWHDVVISGNGLMQAAQLLDWTQIEIDRVPDEWSYDKARAFALADNRTSELSEWILPTLSSTLYELDAAGWDMPSFGFEPLPPPGFGDADPDEVPELPDEPKAKLGDLYELGEHRLLCGDSTSADSYVKVMGGGMADLVFTDPPYGVSVVKKGMVGANFGVAKKGNFRPVEGDNSVEVALKAFAIFGEMCDKVIMWGGNYYADQLKASSCWIVWDKRVETGIENTFADAELAWTSMSGPTRVYRQLWNGMIREGEHDPRVHPTQKPVALGEWCLSKYGKTGNIVLDPFGGSGSTLIACEQTGRKCRMIELDPRYVDVILARWENLTGKKAKLLKSPK